MSSDPYDYYNTNDVNVTSSRLCRNCQDETVEGEQGLCEKCERDPYLTLHGY